MNEPDETGQRPATADPDVVARIATALGLQRDVFCQTPSELNAELPLLQDIAELIFLFSQIDDRQVRRRCIASVRALLDGQGPDTTAAPL